MLPSSENISSVRPTREHEHAYASVCSEDGGRILLSSEVYVSLRNGERASLFPTTGQTKIPSFARIILHRRTSKQLSFCFSPQFGEKFSNLAPINFSINSGLFNSADIGGIAISDCLPSKIKVGLIFRVVPEKKWNSKSRIICTRAWTGRDPSGRNSWNRKYVV